MSGWTLTIEYTTRPDFTFAINPIIEPEWTPEYNDLEPPTLAQVTERWQITDAVFVNTAGGDAGAATMIDAFNTLKDNILDETDPVTAVTAKLNGGNKWRMTTTTHLRLSFNSIKVKGMDRAGGYSFIYFDMVVSGIIPKIFGGGGGSTGVTALKRTLRRSFSGGFETRTLDIEVETSGTSATTQARTEALLTLPGDTWAYVTAGDANVDTEQLDYDADRKARGTCTIREQAISFEGQNTFDVSEGTSKTAEDGTRKSLTVRAQGPAALAQVEAQRPSNWATEVIQNDTQNDQVTATWTFADGDEPLDFTRSFSVEGGNQVVTDIPIARRKKVWKILGHWRPLKITETYLVRHLGPPKNSAMKFQSPVWPKNYRPDQSSEIPPHVVSDSLDPSSTVWAVGLSRVYVFSPDEKAPSADDIFRAVNERRDGADIYGKEILAMKPAKQRGIV